MKTQYYTIEYLKALYTDLEYADNTLYLGEEVIQEDADWLIEAHYDGGIVIKAHPTGNPEQEYPETVDGAEYIEYQFGKDYEKAFLAI